MGEKGVLPNSKIFFHTSSIFAKQSLYYLANAGAYFSSALYETKRDTYEHYLFIHIKKGQMKVMYDNQEFIAKDHSFIFLDCDKPHLYKSLENTVFDWFHFSGSASKNYFELLFQKNGCVFTLGDNQIIPDYMRRILTMMESNKVDEHAASIIIHKILYELDKLSNQKNDTLEETITKAISYIENNYSKEISLAAIANYAKLSPYHFSRLFKKHMNCSPHQYLINYRINKAKQLLYNTKLSIKEIAFTCGFNSISHFTTTFKKHSNVSPKKFRETQF